MTFSITATCGASGMSGIAITTSSISVGSRCPWVRAGAGACATQNSTDPTIGNDVLDLMASGHSASDSVATVMGGRRHADYRQVAAVDLHGRTGHFTGGKTLGVHAVTEGEACIAAGNLLSSNAVTTAMVQAFERSSGMHLATRLVLALDAGVEAGGEEGPTHSAALLVAHEQPWPLVDLRVDWSDQPVTELINCWQRYEPQIQDYVNRALDPASAPTYGVPGDQ